VDKGRPFCLRKRLAVASVGEINAGPARRRCKPVLNFQAASTTSAAATVGSLKGLKGKRVVYIFDSFPLYLGVIFHGCGPALAAVTSTASMATRPAMDCACLLPYPPPFI